MTVSDISHTTSSEELVRRANEFIPICRERAMEAEADSSLSAESFEDLIEMGCARALVPRRFGGLQLDNDSVFEVSRVIGTGDASHGWCAGLLLSLPQYLGCFPMEAQEAVWGDGPDVAIAGSVMPAAKIVADGDGYRVTGRSPYASGVNHAAWSYVGGFIERDGAPEWSLTVIPASDYEVDRNWDTVAMSATGSNTIVTDGAFVPATHVLSMRDLREGDGPGSRGHDDPLYRIPWVSYAALAVQAPMLGAAQGALASFRDWTRTRLTKAGAAMADLPTVQVTMARAAADLDAAELLMRRAVEVTLGDEPPNLDLRARSMRDFGYVRTLITQAADAVMQMSGSAGFDRSNYIQRAWRDVHFMSTHINMNDATLIHWARHELGLPLLPKQLSF